MATHNGSVGHGQNRRRIDQHQVVVFARPLHQLGEAFAHQQLGRVRRHLTAWDQVKFRHRCRFRALADFTFTEQNFRQTVNVVGAQQLVGVALTHIAVDQQHALVGLADDRRQVGADEGFTD